MSNEIREKIANRIKEALADVEVRNGAFGDTESLEKARNEYINSIIDILAVGA